MVRMVALLRGINVGRNKQVPMADLRAVLSRLGYTDVATHLRSGNAVFTCTDAAVPTVAVDVERAVAEELGVQASAAVRTSDQLTTAIAAAPMLDLMTDPARYLVGFLAGDPKPTAAEAIAAIDTAPDQIRLVGSEVYLWCPNGVSKSRLNDTGWEKMLGTSVTTRNWRTVGKLAEMLER